ncbi:MAG: DUF3108 domain-containing protein [Flavobacteriales bacterium]
MKKIILIFALIFGVSHLFAQSTKPPKVDIDTLTSKGYRTLANNAFQAGEKVTYRIHYGFINAGEATISVEESKYTFGGREAYHVVGKGKSLGSFDWFFKVRDHYETYIDKQGVFPYRFIRKVDEGGYKINQDYTFYQDKRAYKDEKSEEFATPDFVQDMISAYFYARTIDYSTKKKGDIITIMTIVDGEIYPLKMKYLGKETVKVDAGKFKCIRFAPVVQKGRVFKKEEDLSVWVTDDENHLPILAEAKILVGSIKMELQSYEGLANTVALVK